MATQNRDKRSVNTAHTVFGVIEKLQELEGAGVSEIADELGMAKSTIHDHLSTLESREYVVKDGHTYHLSLKFLDHGIFAKKKRTLSKVARPTLEQLANETEEVSWLYVEEHGKGVLLDKARGNHAVEIMGRVGKRIHLHSHAGGKAIMAHMDEERQREVIDKHGLVPLTDNTITDEPELRDELEAVREDGIAYNDSESVKGARAVCAPIVPDGELLGAVGVAGPANRLSGDRFRSSIPDKVLGAANEIELRWVYQD